MRLRRGILSTPPVAYAGIAVSCKRNRAAKKKLSFDHFSPLMLLTEFCGVRHVFPDA